MGILTTERLKKRMTPPSSKAEISRWLAITPLLSDDQVSDGAIDLRLGTHFTVTRVTQCDVLDPWSDDWKDIRGVQRQTIIPYGNALVLHPGDFVLGTTVEYVRLPMDLTAYVVGRSSWGRIGLVVATAIAVHAGFAGTITLELVNEAAVPIKLYPGMRICQLVVHNHIGKLDKPKATTYMGQVLSGYSRINEDKDIAILARYSNRVNGMDADPPGADPSSVRP